MDKLDAIRVFVAVATSGGFSAASRLLGLPVATVSRKVAELEETLGVRLFDRSTRQVTLTEGALSYFEDCRRLLEDLREAEEHVMGEHQTPKGELSITAPLAFGRQHLQPVATEFLREFPNVTLRLLLVDRVVNMLEEHVDLALRISVLPDSSFIARPLGEIRMVVCGSPDYLQCHGVPQHPNDLASHQCIAWTALGPYKTWLFREHGLEAMFPIRVRLTTTLPESAVDAAVAGLVLTQITSYQAANAVQSGALVPVLREFEPAPTPVNFIYPSRRAPQKLLSFLDFAVPRLQARLQAIGQLL